MKIELEIPEWAAERLISVFAGNELLAFQYPGQPLYVKASRCSQCGACCHGWGEEFWVGALPDGRCRGLEADGDHYRCRLQLDKPFICCLTPLLDKPAEGCTVAFEKAK